MSSFATPPAKGLFLRHQPLYTFAMSKQLGFFKKQTYPDFSYEEKYSGPVAGLDEVGRGPLAGPVIAAAVILDPANIPYGLNDSKKLTRKRREELFIEIQASCQFGFGEASVDEIDAINILEASMLAMRRALHNLPGKPIACLVDGNRDPGLPVPTRCLIKGDGLSLSIAAASIIAKVFRDKIMSDLGEIHPEYGWAENAGYGVPHHLQALDAVGPCRHHRKSFQPVKRLLLKDSQVSS